MRESCSARGLPTRATQAFDLTFPQVADALREQAAEAERHGRRIVALSVAVGGPLKIREGVLLDPPHLPGWRLEHPVFRCAHRTSAMWPR